MKRFEYIGRSFELCIPHQQPLIITPLSYNVSRDVLRVRLNTGQVTTVSLSLFESCVRQGTVRNN